MQAQFLSNHEAIKSNKINIYKAIFIFYIDIYRYLTDTSCNFEVIDQSNLISQVYLCCFEFKKW